MYLAQPQQRPWCIEMNSGLIKHNQKPNISNLNFVETTFHVYLSSGRHVQLYGHFCVKSFSILLQPTLASPCWPNGRMQVFGTFWYTPFWKRKLHPSFYTVRGPGVLCQLLRYEHTHGKAAFISFLANVTVPLCSRFTTIAAVKGSAATAGEVTFPFLALFSIVLQPCINYAVQSHKAMQVCWRTVRRKVTCAAAGEGATRAEGEVVWSECFHKRDTHILKRKLCLQSFS